MAEAKDHQQVIRGAPHPQALTADRLRQAAGGEVHLVLHLDGIQLRIAFAETQADAGAALTAVGADALQPLQTIELLFQDGGDALLHHLRRRGGKGGPNADPGRCQLRQVLQSQSGEGHQAGQQDQQAADNREDRSAQKRLGERPHRDDLE